MKTISERIKEERLKLEKEEKVLEVYGKEKFFEEEVEEEIKELKENPDLFDKAEDLTKNELIELAKDNNIEFKKSWNKTKLINAIWGK